MASESRVPNDKEFDRLLRRGGRLLLADEVVPQSPFKWLLHWLIRLPLVMVTYALTQTTTHAVRGLPEQVWAAGFVVEAVHPSVLGDFVELVAVKPD